MVAIVVVMRVSRTSVGEQLEQRRTLAGAGPLGGPGDAGRDLVGIVAEQRDARHAVARRTICEPIRRGLLADVRAERPAVVLDHENHRKAPHSGEVDGLVPLAETGAALPQQRDADPILSAHLVRL